MFHLHEWHMSLAVGFIGGSITTWLAMKLHGKLKKVFHLALLGVSLQACAGVTPLAVVLRTAGAAAQTGHAINQGKKAYDKALRGEEEQLSEWELARIKFDKDLAEYQARGCLR